MRKSTLLLAAIAAATAVLVSAPAARAADVPIMPDPGGGTGDPTGTPPGSPVPIPATYDHLKCYKFKDAKPFFPGPVVGTFPSQPFVPQDCEIKKVKATELCIDVEKFPDPTKLGPIPPIGAYPVNAWDYLCYKVKCEPKVEKGFAVFVADQFGARIGEIKDPKRFCVPLLDKVVLGP